MSVLNNNWKIYQDPTYARDKESVLKSKLPAGAKMFFRAQTVDALVWVLRFVMSSVFDYSGSYLEGFDPATERCVATFYGGEFRVLDGLGDIQVGQYEVKGLRINEGYEEFLLRLIWRAPRGWKTEMHAIALASNEDNGIIWSYDESINDID